MFSYLVDLVKKHFTFIKFGMVGVINTLFSYCVYSFFIWIGIHYSIASFISSVAGIIFNFFTTGRIVFKNNDNSRIFLFFGAYGIVWLFNVSCIWCATHLGFTNLYIIGFVMIFPCALLSYFLMKTVVFRSKKE